MHKGTVTYPYNGIHHSHENGKAMWPSCPFLTIVSLLSGLFPCYQSLLDPADVWSQPHPSAPDFGDPAPAPISRPDLCLFPPSAHTLLLQSLPRLQLPSLPIPFPKHSPAQGTHLEHGLLSMPSRLISLYSQGSNCHLNEDFRYEHPGERRKMCVKYLGTSFSKLSNIFFFYFLK